MSTSDEQLQEHWHTAIAEIAARLDDFKARIEYESQMLYSVLSAEITTLQEDLKDLELNILAAGPTAYARQIAMDIEALRVRGDAVYRLLQTGLPAELDPKDAEIRRLETAAKAASQASRAYIFARLDALRSERPVNDTAALDDSSAEQSCDAEG
jgi:hypothetical protein